MQNSASRPGAEFDCCLKENTPEETSGVFSGWLSGFGVGLSLTNIDYEIAAKLHMDKDVIPTVELCSVP